jgi:hypothetical protein
LVPFGSPGACVLAYWWHPSLLRRAPGTGAQKCKKVQKSS